jgi:S1-C subfamily serine protease
MRDLYRALKGLEVGSKQTLQVVRAGEVKNLEVTVGERDQEGAPAE